MELEVKGIIFMVTHNEFDFVPQGKSEADRLVGVAHHVFVLDYAGIGKTPDAEGSERSVVDVRVSDDQVAQLGKLLTKDTEVHWRLSVRPNGAKFRYDLLAPVAVKAA